MQEPGCCGLDNPGDQRLNADDCVDGGKIERVKEAPVSRGLPGSCGRPVAIGEREAVTVEHPLSQRVIGDLIEDPGQRRDRVALVPGTGAAGDDSEDDNGSR